MNFLKTGVPAPQPGVLTQILKNRLGGWGAPRSYARIHASMLTDTPEFCPREVAISRTIGKQRKAVYTAPAMQVAYDQGAALHELFRNDWVRDIVVGVWRCVSCGTKVPFSKYPKAGCDTCSGKRFEYEEEVFDSVTEGYGGSLDSLLDFGWGKHTIVELKSMDKDEFKDLKAPKAEHRVRTILYMHLVRTSDRPESLRIDTQRAKVLYISKAFGQKDVNGDILPFKEFDVDYNETTIKPYLAKSRAVKLWKEEGVFPKGVCATSFVNRVKYCCCPQECWSGKYPPSE